MLTVVPVFTVAPAVGDVIIEVGGIVSWTVTVTCAGGSWTFPLLSIARLLIVADPGRVGIQLYLHAVVPVATFHVAPPSTDTWTDCTIPPPASLAVPVMLTVVPVITIVPAVGAEIVEVGSDLSWPVNSSTPISMIAFPSPSPSTILGSPSRSLSGRLGAWL